MARSCRVVAVDVGSVRGADGGNYAWAALDLTEGRPGRAAGAGSSPDGTVDCVVRALAGGVSVAVGWEAPSVVPVPGADGWRELGRRRSGEGRRPWSAGAGAGALATGLAQAGWLLRAVATRIGQVDCTCDPERWEQHGGLLLWEAFVSAEGKPVPLTSDLIRPLTSQHAADAAAAAARFAEVWQSGPVTLHRSEVTTAPHFPFNLLAAAALAAGLSIPADELSRELLALKTAPPATARLPEPPLGSA